MERDLKTLRRSRLMNYSEFRTMATALERFHKDVNVAMMITGKSTGGDKKEMDMRPYLYDEGDSYERPFYTTLLKMLYEVATSTFYEKQYEDLVKIYKWYCANKKLITSPPKIPIPSPKSCTPEPEVTDTPDIEQDGSSDDLEITDKFIQVPKLHIRPKTAPPVEHRQGARYVTWNDAQKDNGPKRPSSGKPTGFQYQHNKADYVKEQLAKSLRVRQCGPYKEVPYIPDKSYRHHLARPVTAPPPNRTLQVRMEDPAGLKSFVLKPFSTPVPKSSPINSPLTSPRDSPVPFSRAKSPQLSVDFAPITESSVKLNVRLPQTSDSSHQNAGQALTGNGNANGAKENGRHQNGHDSGSGSPPENQAPDDLPAKLPNQSPLPNNASASEIQRILENQRREEELLEEQHSLLQKRLLHEYDRYARDCSKLDRERTASVEMVSGELAVNLNGRVVHPAPVGTYDLSSPQIIPSYNRVYSHKHDTTNNRSAQGPAKQSGYSPARYLKHAGMERPDEVIRIDAVLGMATPIGMQMEYDRERASGYTGFRQPVAYIPHSVPNTQASPVAVPTERIQLTTSSSASTSSQDSDSSRSGLAEQRPLELKSKEPELSPDRTTRDYTVHFHQNKSTQEKGKHFKVSGPVAPDTIRYQWTDDGFGSMTYMKRLKSPVSPRTPRKNLNSTHNAKQSPDQVIMETGSRPMSKRALASLMVVKQLGDADRRTNERFGGQSSGKPYIAPEPDPEPTYNLGYMSICQPVGPRLGETERPSTVAWYLQGENGLYRDPSSPRYDSDEIRRKRDVRIPQDRSLMVHGKHIGGESDTCPTPPDLSTTDVEKPKHENSENIFKPDNSPTSSKLIETKPGLASPRGSLRPTSPKPSRPLSPKPSRPHSSSPHHRHIAIPTGGGCSSRPCSARSEKSEKTHNFSVKQFNHFCWPDEHLLDEDYIRQREVWAAVNIQRIFRGFMARQYYQNLQQAEFDRQRKAVLTLQSHMRGFLARKKMELRMKEYKPSTRTKEWARQYKEELKQREAARAQKKHLVLIQLNKGAEKQDEQMKNVKAHQNIYDIYHPTPEGPTKAQKKAAAIIIQRYFRGWFVRRMYQKVKTKALKRTLSFNKFIKGYQTLLYRIQKRYGVTDPTTALQFNELMEYVERLNKYEIAFEKFAVNGTLSYNDIKEYFKACGHQPSQKEIDEAIEIVTKMSAKGRNLTKAEAVEVLFQIYVPKGTGLKLQDVRKSTWLNPLSEGQDIMQLLSKKDLEATNLGKCLEVVANAGKENDEIQELLRPSSARSESKASKKGEKNGKTKQATLAQYPMRPSSSSSSRAKSPKPYKTRR
ncbi:uncharacterized protein LOC5519268 isoform X2 [Nematostella vectensis]|uniref:uncharacterized protein LOC5519268 isoform X2 n=1 Tax=Nematostella vectensis TaxID=45351 RepID=UPI002077670D|nr:uncharacterized protein LOC5519268 isoform X2 [Nematostella vectensis]